MYAASHTGGHILDTRLHCDGREHFYPCVLKGCTARQYFCKHLPNDRHCPRSPLPQPADECTQK